MRHAARKDENHNPIESAFRRLLADHVTDSSKWAGGCGDLFVSCGKYQVFIEIKRDGKADYTAHQIRFHNTHEHAVLRCETVDQAIELCATIRQRAWALA